MADINVEMLREKLYKAAIALSCISEVCVDVSKQHISAERAIDKIRDYLHDTNAIGSRYRVDRLIDDCTIGECSRDEIARQIFEDYFLILDNQKNHPLYSTNAFIEDCCMTATTSTGAYIFDKEHLDIDKQSKADANRIKEAVDRTKKYIKE